MSPSVRRVAQLVSGGKARLGDRQTIFSHCRVVSAPCPLDTKDRVISNCVDNTSCPVLGDGLDQQNMLGTDTAPGANPGSRPSPLQGQLSLCARGKLRVRRA